MTEIKINNHAIQITHPNKILFAKEKITKKAVAEYYLNIADYMLPFIKDRPITIQCFPDGCEKPSFFRQHAPDNLPKWFKTATLKTKAGGSMTHMLCQNKETLIYLANQNTVEIHRWLSKAGSPDQPDIMIIDIDPPSECLGVAILAAKLLRERLIEMGYLPDLMLTGSLGLHVISRCKKGESFEEIKNKLHELTNTICEDYKDKFTTEIRKDKRAGRVYLDISRNAYGQTAIAPFSLRAKANAPVATPIRWEELEIARLRSNKYTIKNIFGRFK